ncbi:HEPN domain-containing protein [Gramella sp. MAR_2010_147]|uniref:ApeA N-terminal domain 1-containing protein n=1 Tax=Gramella sp. MAR_2010_147 TaxID=1250205 RepID=UPI00087B3295|nr:HEPN domain-containing protein [Gramella sp. MAR_2010_147]SDR91541.1 hypothetical protein SAMN04488553_1020 [Gramella sp. MAR_2010_147]
MEYYNCYFEGVFWTPENEDSKIIATLNIDDKGIVTISSLQSLIKGKRMTNEGWNKLKIVFGYINSHDTSKSYSVKLYNVNQIHQSDGALSKFKYQSSNSLISKAFDEDIENLNFNSIMLNSNIVSQWIPITGFKWEPNGYEDKNFKVNQLYEQPKKIEVFKNADYNIYIFFRASAGYPVKRNSYIREEVFFIIETASSFDLKQLYKSKATIERLLNIILFVPFYSTNVEFRSSTGSDYIDLGKSKELSIGRSNPLKFKVFQEHSQEIFTKWFEKQKAFELLIKNFFSVFGQKGVLIENKFLTYVSVLENYHKNNVKKSAILKNRLFNILKNSSFNEKIIDIDKYAEKLKVTRNYHAHLEEKHEKNSLDSKGILYSNRILEVIIHEIMLQELGVSEFKIPQSEDKIIGELNKILE